MICSSVNLLEAQTLVAELVLRLRDPREGTKSIGVVTLNSEQQHLVEDLLDAERRADPELECFFGDAAAEPVFVKNLETVQGDQRDVILLSIGYGPTEPGARTMSMNCGPLNRQGGERRLNVAITRAMSEVVIFASFGPEMIDLTRSSARAVQELKHYLEFAERGPSALGAAIRPGGMHIYDSDFEMAVAEGLSARGWDVRTQVGVSKSRVDLGIVHPDASGLFLAGVECDGATHHSSPSARDRDRVRHIIPEQLGWPLLRLWSTDWFLDSKACLDRLHGQLQELLIAERLKCETLATPEPTSVIPLVASTVSEAASLEFALRPEAIGPVEGESTSTLSAPTNATPDREATAPIHTTGGIAAPLHVPEPEPGRFYDPDYAHTLAAMVAQIIAAEAPMTLHRLARLIARRHGFQRTGRKIGRVVRTVAETIANIASTEDGGECIWRPDQQPSRSMPFRGIDVSGEARPWMDVPYPEKIGFAQGFRHHADAVRAMADSLGLGRLAATTREEFENLLVAAREIG